MSKAKDFMVQHNKKGPVKLGSLSSNELCRSVVGLMDENRTLQLNLAGAWEAYQNHVASYDALALDEVIEMRAI